MKRLNYDVLKAANVAPGTPVDAPERFLQIGEGNFLRAFVDYFIDVANERVGFQSKVTVVQPIAKGLSEMIQEQEGLYTLYMRGLENGKKLEEKRIISCINRAINPYADYNAFLSCAKNPSLRFVVSNTTEAGITYDPDCLFEDKPPASFPGKLTQFLYERYKNFEGASGSGFVILPCELIDHNGSELKKCVQAYARQWQLGLEFLDWLEKENDFCSTLVDRIVTGYPKSEVEALNEENGYEDSLIDTSEIFGLWVIEGPERLEKELPFAEAGLPVKIVRDHTPYKQRKVRILNGAHTSMVPAAYLAGKNIVRECMEDPVIRGFMEKAIYEEIIPTLTLPEGELRSFAESVADRFQNPFIDHSLLSITLNCTSKWRARVLPSLKAYFSKEGRFPTCLTFSFAAYIAFYRGAYQQDGGYYANRAGEDYVLSDDLEVLAFYSRYGSQKNRELIEALCRCEKFWGEDLSQLTGFVDQVTKNLDAIEQSGMHEAMQRCI